MSPEECSSVAGGKILSASRAIVMRMRHMNNKLTLISCGIVALLTLYAMMEVCKLHISNSVQLEYARLQQVKKEEVATHVNKSLPRTTTVIPFIDDSEEREMRDSPTQRVMETTVEETTVTQLARTTTPPATTTLAEMENSTAEALMINDALPHEWNSKMSKQFYIEPKARVNRTIPVTIVIAMLANTNMTKYVSARTSVECYAALHGYDLAIIFDDKYEECKNHTDFYFKRHCTVYHYMTKELKEDRYMLFLDSDIGVVNPRRLIEDYIHPDFDIYLYDRFWNWEYAACSYMVKNNELGRSWVKGFGDLEFHLPKSQHGTDNGALHPYMMFFLVPETRNAATRSRMAALCLSIWNQSKDWDDVFAMEACVRTVVGERNVFKDKRTMIYAKGQSWARDSWILHSHWTDDDLMFHAVKEEIMKTYPADEETRKKCRQSTFDASQDGMCNDIFPVLNKLNADKCKAGTQKWLMEGRLQLTPQTKKKILNTIANQVLRNQMGSVGGRAQQKIVD